MDSNQNKHLTVSTGEAALDLLPVLGPRSSQTGPVCSLAAAGTPRGWARGGGVPRASGRPQTIPWELTAV